MGSMSLTISSLIRSKPRDVPGTDQSSPQGHSLLGAEHEMNAKKIISNAQD